MCHVLMWDVDAVDVDVGVVFSCVIPSITDSTDVPNMLEQLVCAYEEHTAYFTGVYHSVGDASRRY